MGLDSIPFSPIATHQTGLTARGLEPTNSRTTTSSSPGPPPAPTGNPTHTRQNRGAHHVRQARACSPTHASPTSLRQSPQSLRSTQKTGLPRGAATFENLQFCDRDLRRCIDRMSSARRISSGNSGPETCAMRMVRRQNLSNLHYGRKFLLQKV